MLNAILTILAAGVPGMLTYWLLVTFGILNYTKNDSFEKTSALAFFSFINTGIGIGIYDFISRKNFIFIYKMGQFPPIGKFNINVPAYINLGICTLISTLILSVFIYPIMFKGFMYLYKKVIKWLKLPVKSAHSTLWEALNKYNDVDATVYIFDLEGNFIGSGTAARLSDYDEDLSIATRDATGYNDKGVVTLEAIMECYNNAYETDNEEEKKEPEIVHDLKNKFQFIIIY